MIAFIDDHRDAYGVEPICKVLPIAPSTYHAHAARRADPGRLPARVKRDAVLAVEIRRVSKVVGEDVVSLDLLLVTPLVEDVWQARESLEFMGETLFVVSRDGLIKMKRQAGRPQDLADIERLENETS